LLRHGCIERGVQNLRRNMGLESQRSGGNSASGSQTAT
jgi:hypothetical protein